MKTRPCRRTAPARPARATRIRRPQRRCDLPACRLRNAAREAKSAIPFSWRRSWARSVIWLVLERSGCGQQPLVAGQVRDVVAKTGDEQRPLIEHPHHNDVARAAGFELHVVDEVAAVVDLTVDRHVLERAVLLHVEINAVLAIEQYISESVGPSGARANVVQHEIPPIPQMGPVIARSLRLTGRDQTRGILVDGFEHLAGKENDRRLDDRTQQRHEYRSDQRKLDGGRAAAVAAKPAPSSYDRDR